MILFIVLSVGALVMVLVVTIWRAEGKAGPQQPPELPDPPYASSLGEGPGEDQWDFSETSDQDAGGGWDGGGEADSGSDGGGGGDD